MREESLSPFFIFPSEILVYQYGLSMRLDFP